MIPRLQQIHDFVIWPTLEVLRLNSLAARQLLLGTIAHESKGQYIDQILSSSDRNLGPAIGLYQIEPATHDDVIENFLKYRTSLYARVVSLRANEPSKHEQLATNLAYSTAIARCIYFRRPEALPQAGDNEGLAAYWKQWYNTHLGAGTEAQFLRAYEREVASLDLSQPEGA